jgi:hypothetical protein
MKKKDFTFNNGKSFITIDDLNPKWNMDDVPNLVYKYGLDCQGNPITAPDGYELITKHCKIEKDFIHFDIYGGWVKGCIDYQVRNGHHISMGGKGGFSDNMGRWICWAKPIK